MASHKRGTQHMKHAKNARAVPSPRQNAPKKPNSPGHHPQGGGGTAILLRDCANVVLKENLAIGVENFLQIEGEVVDLDMTDNIHIPYT